MIAGAAMARSSDLLLQSATAASCTARPTT